MYFILFLFSVLLICIILANISHFQDTRQQIAELSGVHSLLKRLQFLFKFPGKLRVTLQEGNYAQVFI
jgi:hypothetical protein